ncbi:hypothetical protein GCM10010525_21580 [Glutamicibacter bergerei]
MRRPSNPTAFTELSNLFEVELSSAKIADSELSREVFAYRSNRASLLDRMYLIIRPMNKEKNAPDEKRLTTSGKGEFE